MRPPTTADRARAEALSLRPARTPVRLLEHASRAAGREVWLKADGHTHARYGGNKVRKLAALLDDARARGARALVTLGAAGSHHVLATAVHGYALRFEVHAALTPQPRTAHAEATLRATLAHGAQVLPAHNAAALATALAARMLALRAAGLRPYFIPLGGSTPRGALGYALAAAELAEQARGGELPALPDAVYCPLGSAGTAAGLVAGAALLGLPAGWVRGVAVAPAVERLGAALWRALAERTHALARQATRDDARFAGARGRPVSAHDARVLRGYVGAGYGAPSDAGARACEVFARDGVTLEPTYGAKTAAALLADARTLRPGARVLFLETLSQAPLEPLQRGRSTLPAGLDALFT